MLSDDGYTFALLNGVSFKPQLEPFLIQKKKVTQNLIIAS